MAAGGGARRIKDVQRGRRLAQSDEKQWSMFEPITATDEDTRFAHPGLNQRHFTLARLCFTRLHIEDIASAHRDSTPIDHSTVAHLGTNPDPTPHFQTTTALQCTQNARGDWTPNCCALRGSIVTHCHPALKLVERYSRSRGGNNWARAEKLA